MIRLEHVSKTFSGQNEVHAVRDVSLHIAPGEIFGIIGFSGAGKSTLVRCINLLERPTQGKVFVDGVELTALDIVENPKNLDIEELEAAQLPRSLDSLDLAVINGNYAMEAGLTVADALAIESAHGTAATAYGNILVTKEGRENDPAIQALAAALQSDTVKDYIATSYSDGSVVTVF